MRIGIVTTWFERGAAYVSRQYRDILNKEHEVFIFARGGEEYAIDNPEWDTSDVTWATKLPSEIPTIINLIEFKKWIRRKKIDIVFFNEQWWWPAVIEAKASNLIVGAYVDYYTEQTLPFFGLYDFLICNTKKHMAAFSWHPGAVFVPWGTNIDVFRPTNSKTSRPKITFFHSAGVSPGRKGCDLVIKAFYKLGDDCKLIIHTQANLQATFPELTETINNLHAQGRLIIHEKTVSAPGLFHLGDVYIYPTRLEGIGLTIMEAAACGLPVIVTNDGPMNEFITHGKNGRLIDVDRLVSRADGYYWPQAIASVESLALQMQWYIDNIDLMPSLKITARQVAENNFNWNNVSNLVLNTFATAKQKSDDSLVNGKILKKIEDYEHFQQKKYKLDTLVYLKKIIEINYPKIYYYLVGIKKIASRHTSTK